MPIIPMPSLLQDFYALFPLHFYSQSPSLPSPRFPLNSQQGAHGISTPTLFIHRPVDPSRSLLSSDIECVKWQAYLALRGVHGGIRVRWDLASEGALDGKLPNLYLAPSSSLVEKENRGELGKSVLKGELLESRRIPSWVDGEAGRSIGSGDNDPILEGYKDEESRDESRAWVSLLEGDVYAAIKAVNPSPSLLSHLSSFPPPHVPEQPLLSKTLTGVSSMITPFGSVIVPEPLLERYREAMEALSNRLKSDKWFLGSK
jgi:metaxin